MPSQRTENSDSHLAESLKLAPKVYIHLRDSLQSGEFPVWLRTGDPVLAGKFFDAFEFEMLCEKLHSQESLERRRHNLAVRFQEKGMQDDAEKALSAYDEGRLEDLSFSLDASAPAQSDWGFHPTPRRTGGSGHGPRRHWRQIVRRGRWRCCGRPVP